MTDHPSVHEAIAGVIRDLPAVGKDSEVTQGARYKYRGIEAIKAALKPLLAQHGVHYAPTTITEIADSTYQTKQGDTWQRIRMIVGYTVYGPAGDSIPAVGRGEGADNSDKACNKAMTVAEKQMLVQVFCIADADGDPDASRAEEQAVYVERPPVPIAGFKGGLKDALGQPAAKAWWDAHNPGDGPWAADDVDRMIEEAKQWEPPESVEPELPHPPTDAAVKRLHVALKEAGITDEDRHDWATLQLGRQIDTYTDLSRADVAKLTQDAKELVTA